MPSNDKPSMVLLVASNLSVLMSSRCELKNASSNVVPDRGIPPTRTIFCLLVVFAPVDRHVLTAPNHGLYDDASSG
eukprot:CAMPEP_0183459812 /NCGR_PEP_ID=MMETSP0370-20130417/136346_1 /TAXON_ID=268820 /ORGANISM="Peridinium aciculiferum, Strain PAER-2" /LENGTH=75 /DNA_ID=CAMNT_0025651663 /DNA_START=532 /DNA_END=755 /DNA_ORIENTATION=+